MPVGDAQRRMASMPPAPKHTRRRFQFGLGTMFVMVTVVAVWLGWELTFVRERRTALEWLKKNGGFVVSVAETKNNQVPPPEPVNEIPIWRRWLGDEAMYFVVPPDNATEDDLSRFQRLFPEAVWPDLIDPLK